MAHDIHGVSHPAPLEGRSDLHNFMVVRAFVLLLIFGPSLACSCQPPSASELSAKSARSGWQSVESISLGTSIKLKSRTGSMNCALIAVDDNSITCAHPKNTVFNRNDILSIAIPHRGRSALIMGGVGAGVGVAVVKLVATAAFGGFFQGHAKGAVYAGGAGLGILVFAPIGYGTDVTHSTIYKAP